VVSGADRAEALARLRGALVRCRLDGVATTVAMLSRMVDDPEFGAGGVDTGWLRRWLARGRTGAGGGTGAGAEGGAGGGAGAGDAGGGGGG
jgi:acetyl-CoA carboxylase, biotin carboxylase subunit